MSAIEEWWAAGERVPITLSGVERRIFVRRLGEGPSLTLLHGFPSCSHEWAKVVPALAAGGHSLLMPDLLGFGASAKPADHDYTLAEQSDLVAALWRRYGIERTRIVAHDYSVSVVQELLARRAEGTLATDIRSVHLQNGGLYPDLHRPLDIQKQLAERGEQASAALSANEAAAALALTFAPGYDFAADAADIQASIERGGNVTHRLIAYMQDRRDHAERWVSAIEQTDVPRSFVWGMLDPISGAHIAERIAERMTEARLDALPDVSHWPPLEAPGRVVADVLAAGA